ncbi:hypothetical protein RDMS_12715 [Deinococcus sp. RL]|nr:hypothetical protein RDMS_12715 [Deinococcus sp. RL]
MRDDRALKADIAGQHILPAVHDVHEGRVAQHDRGVVAQPNGHGGFEARIGVFLAQKGVFGRQ